MIDMACQFLDVTCIPRDLETIIREKSHGVGSWCEQLVKDMLSSNYIKVVKDKDVVMLKERNVTTEAENIKESNIISSSQSSTSLATEAVRQYSHFDTVPPVSPTSTKFRGSISSASSTYRHWFSKKRKSINIILTSLNTFRRTAVAAVSSDADLPVLMDSEKSRKSFSKQNRKSSSVYETTSKFEQESDSDDEIFMGMDAIPFTEPSIPEVSRSPDLQKRHATVLSPIPSYFLPHDYFVYANPSALGPDTHNMCIVTPGQDLTKIPVPESLREMVIARFDRLPPLEKVVLKCSSILGDCFPSNLVAAIVPKSAAANVNLALYNLVKV